MRMTEKEIEDKIRQTANEYARLVVLDTQKEFVIAQHEASRQVPNSTVTAQSAINWINMFTLELLNRFK